MLASMLEDIGRPLVATLDTSVMDHKIRSLRSNLVDSGALLAVLKADAYGHGVDKVLPVIQPHIDGVGVCSLEEALHVRSLHYQGPLVLMSQPLSEGILPYLAQYQLTPVLFSSLGVALAGKLPPCKLWLKVNTGMNRLGLRPQEAAEAFTSLTQQGHQVLLMTHIAGESAVDSQVAQLCELVKALQPQTISLCNSSALEQGVDQRLQGTLKSLPHPVKQWIRPGRMLYHTADQTAMEITTGLIQVQTLQRGEKVSYQWEFEAERPMRIGVLAAGYADGIPFLNLQSSFLPKVMIHNIACPIVGQVCMDLCMVDLSACPSAKQGDKATFLPPKTRSEADFIYAMTGLNKRVPRRLQGEEL